MAEHQESPVLNRVLLTGSLPFRTFERAGGKTIVVDGSGLPYLVEEMIALSAVQVVVPDNVVASGFVDGLASPLKDRVKVVSARRASDATLALCGPIGDEFGFKLEHGSVRGGDNLGLEIGRAFITFWSALPNFLLGMEYEIQVDVNLSAATQAVQILREASKSARTRAVMAAFQGVFATYRPTEIASLTLISSASDDLARLLERLVEDETFRKLSASVHTVAFPDKRDRALTLARRLAEDLASLKIFKNLFGAGTRAVETATHVPLPDREALGDMIGTTFLPALVSLARAEQNARRLWREQDPAFVPPSGWDGTVKRP